MDTDTSAAPTATACDTRSGEVCLDLVGSFHAMASQFEATFYDHENADGARPGVRGGLARYGAGRPEPGRYPLGVLDRASRDGQFYLMYYPSKSIPTDTNRSFVSVDGELLIEESAPDRIRGTFSFAGNEYAASWRTGQRGSGSPSAVAPDASRIRVRGGFTLFAGATSPRIVMACGGPPGPAVVVEVRDPQGRPAATGTTIVAQDGEFKDSVDWSLPSPFVGAGDRRPGRYEVRLYKPGYRAVVIKDVIVPSSGPPCNIITGSVRRRVTLQLLRPDARVHSVVVLPPGAVLGGPRYTMTARAVVHAARGVSHAVSWSSSDTSIVRIVPTSDTSAIVCPQPRTGEARITATSRVDPQIQGVGRVSVMVALGANNRGAVDSLSPTGPCRRS